MWSNLQLYLLLLTTITFYHCNNKIITNQIDIERQDEMAEEWAALPPPSPLIEITDEVFKAAFDKVKTKIDTLKKQQNQFPQNYQYQIEQQFEKCIGAIHSDVNIPTDTIFFSYSLISKSEVLLLSIQNRNGIVKNIDIIRTIHNCLNDAISINRYNEKVNPETGRLSLLLFGSYVLIEDGEFVR